MKTHALVLGMIALTALGACTQSNRNKQAAGLQSAQTPQAQKEAGTQTIPAGLPSSGRFMAVAKAAGLDQTLAGPGPYTVFIPTDAAFDKAPAGTFDTSPKNRPQLTAVIRNLVLPGTVLVADIDQAIDRSNGKALLATMGGGTLTATKEGGNTVLTDSEGDKATITQGDQKFTNGVVHTVDAVLLPSKTAAPLSVGGKAGRR